MKLTNLSLFLSIICFWLTSCVSSEIIDSPDSPETASDEIVLHLSSPDDVKTRASNHDGYKLRYVAKLFSTKSAQGGDFILKQRKDITEGETDGNEITFKAEEGKYYVMVFADYIPVESSKNVDNIYPDCFYDTSSTDIDIKTKKNYKIDETFFNSDNLDCFSAVKANIDKTSARYDIENFVLDRAVAKVRFVDISDNPVENSIISFTQVPYFSEFHQTTQSSANLLSEKISNIEIDALNNDEKEIFYYYTFSPDGNGYKLMDLVFDVKSGDKTTKIKIEDGTIGVRKNYITTVKGKFIPGNGSGDNSSQEGNKDTDTGEKKDDGLIHVWPGVKEEFTGNIECEFSPI